MKKVFLALVCFASVAFFASCGGETDKNPTISLSADKTTIDSPDVVTFTIKADANATSKKDLVSVSVNVTNNDQLVYDTIYTATGLTFEQELKLELNNPTTEAVVFEVTATVNDAAALNAAKTVEITVNPAAATPLEPKAFTWNRRGSNDATGLAEFGLEWNGNYAKAIYATITPAAGVTMYSFESSVFEAVTTETEKAAAFENATVIQQWKEFNVAGATTQTFNTVIGTKTADGEFHLIHITNGSYTSGSYGVDVTITGMAK